MSKLSYSPAYRRNLQPSVYKLVFLFRASYASACGCWSVTSEEKATPGEVRDAHGDAKQIGSELGSTTADICGDF